jgi:hypothetical protein
VSDGKLDPHKPAQICVVGRKGSGKTELAYLLFDTYPFDRVAIDPNGDLKMPEDAVELEAPLPSRWPGEQVAQIRGDKAKRQTLYFVPDFHEPTYLDDMDRVMGMSFSHGRCCTFFDEAHEGMPANRTPPHARRKLRQGRHRENTDIYATPRPMTVDPLMICNADWVYVFDLPNPADRKRVAENTGLPPREMDEAVGQLGEYEYLRYDAARKDWAHLPALPPDRIRHHKS